MSHDIAIVGMGARFPGSPSVAGFWDTIVQARVCAAPISRERWDNDDFYSSNGAREHNRTYVRKAAHIEDVRSFAPEFFGMTPRRAKVMDPQQRLMLEVVRTAMEDAGYADSRRPFPRARTGVFVGATVSDFMDILTTRVRATQILAGEYGVASALADKGRVAVTGDLAPMQAYSMVGSLMNMVAANVSQTFDFGGPSFTTDAACSSGLVSLHEAVWQLRVGVIDAAVVGGVYLFFTPDTVVAFARIGALSHSDACRPFDRRADGFVLGEGLGAVILRRVEDAEAAGDRIHAVIRGVAANSDGKAEGPMTPRRGGQLLALEGAYADARISPRTVGFIEGHGTATPVGDAIEVGAIRDCLSRSPGPAASCALASVKANIGHSMGAAGIAGLIKASLSLVHRTIPPQANCGEPRPDLELESAGLYIPHEARPWAAPDGHPRRAGVNAFGFGGTNVHVVLEEPRGGDRRRRSSASITVPVAVGEQALPPLDQQPPRTELVVLSAPTAALLARAARELGAALDRLEPAVGLRDVAYTLARRRADGARLALVVRDLTDLQAKLRAVAEQLTPEPPITSATPPTPAAAGPAIAGLPEGCFVAAAPVAATDRRMAFLFPGQGAQAPDQCRDLHDRFPVFRTELARLAAAADSVESPGGAPPPPRPLLSLLYPAAATAATEAALTATEVCQPALAALSLAMARFVRSLGLEADLVAGHSLGEITAAAAGGLIADDGACVRFVAERGRIIAETTGETRGVMSAAACDADTAERALAGVEGAVLSNLNHPRQVVVAGTEAGVAEVEGRLKDAGIRTRRLRVSHAFHSPLMKPAAERLTPAVERLPLAVATVPVVSATRGALYGADLAAARETLIGHATARVRFDDAIRACAAEGVRIFVQIASGSALVDMAAATLAQDEGRFRFLTLSASAPDGGATFLRGLGELFVAGAPLRTEGLFEGESTQLVAMLPPSLLETRALWPVSRAQPDATLAVEAAGASEPVQAAGRDTPQSSPFPSQTSEAARLPARAAPSGVETAAVEVTTMDAAHSDPKTKEAPSPGGTSEPGGLGALFRDQMALFEAQLAIVRQQNELLAAASAPAPATAAARDPAAGPPPIETLAFRPVSRHVADAGVLPPGGPTEAATPPDTGPSAADIEGKVTEIVARITALSSATLTPATRLRSGLGFDSLMVVELMAGLKESIPAIELPSRTFFAGEVTIGGLARHLHESLTRGTAAGPRVPALATPTAEVERYVVSYAPAAVAVRADAELLAPVVILADRGGVAPALQQMLAERQVVASLLEPGGQVPAAGATVVDLRALEGAPSLTNGRTNRRGRGAGSGPTNGAERHDDFDLATAADFTAAATSAFELARQLDGRRPSTLLFAHRGLASAGVAGLAKSLGHEWEESRVLAVEMEAGAPADVVARRLIDELSGSESAAEVRYVDASAAGRVTPVLRSAPLPNPVGSLRQGCVVAISGGGAGLGARLALRLARRHGARLLLLGRRPADGAVGALLAEVRGSGGEAEYLRCDVRDAAAVAGALTEGRRRFGPIEIAVHAAGVIEDAPVGRKDGAGFVRVFETKVAGALALWAALADDPLSTFLCYGSWAGRFGNAHQSDYSAASHTLSRLGAELPGRRPGVRVVTMALPPWEGSTMLAGVPAAVKAEMRSRGVTFLSEEVGLDHVVAELSSAGAESGEVLLGAAMPARSTDTVVRTRLSVQTHPFLDHHRLAGRPVLPMATAVDLMREAARLAGTAPERILAMRELAVLNGVILTEDSIDVVARAWPVPPAAPAAPAALAALAVDQYATELLSVAPDGRTGLAYRSVVAVSDWLPPLAGAASLSSPNLPISLDDFYSQHTFHGPSLRAIDQVTVLEARRVEGVIRTSQSPSDLANVWLLAVDGALQLCAYWAAAHHGRVGLPLGVAQLRCRPPIAGGGRLLCRAILRGGSADRFEGDLDLLTEDGEPVVQLRGLRAELLAPQLPGQAPTSSKAPPESFDSSTYRVDEFPEVKDLQAKMDLARDAGIHLPYFRTIDSCTGSTALIGGRSYINFTSYNYAGLSGEPRITSAVADAVARYGSSASASRVTGGQKPIHAELEEAMAAFLGTESSLVMVGGHATNVSVIGHLVGPEDLVLHDSLAHDSILGGARLAGARRRPFAHNDPEALGRILREVRSSVRRVLIAVEGVYSMDGDITPLPAIIELKRRHGAMLFVDEAHSLGVLGATGRGVGEHYGVDRSDVEIWMGTLSKSLASCGGYIAGSAVLTQYLKYTLPGFVYSVGISPANAAAALTALRILTAEPERARLCQERARFFLRLCRERGVDTGDSRDSSVVPCIVGGSYAAMGVASALLERGIHVHPIIYPAVADSEARLRFFITASHTEDQLRITADALAEELGSLALSSGREARAPAESRT